LGKTFRKRNQEEHFNAESIEGHLNTVSDLYKLHMKKFNIVIDMMDSDNKPKYENLRVKIRDRDENVPYFALYEQLTYPYKEYQSKVKIS